MRRFVQALSAADELADAFPAAIAAALQALPDRYNLGVGAAIGTVYAEEGSLFGAALQWGLVPKWEKQPSTRYSTANARADTAAGSPAFRSAWRHRRALVPLTGYFKWDRETTPRQPYFVSPEDGRVAYAAALWERWVDPLLEQPDLVSVAILTTTRKHSGRPILREGPVLLPPELHSAWLLGDTDTASAVAGDGRRVDLGAYAVSRIVNKRSRDDYTLLAPADEDAAIAPPYDPDDYDEVDMD